MDWLRKSGTDRVFVRTSILAGRPDMMAITEEDAAALMAKVASGTAKLEKDKPANSDNASVDPVDAMDEEALRAKAAELKIIIKDNTPLGVIRKKIKKVASQDAKDASDISGTAASTKIVPAQGEPTEPKE